MISKVSIVRGTTDVLDIVLNDESGAVYEIAAGEKVVFGVKCDTDDADFILLKTAQFLADEGVYEVTFTPEDTADLDCRDYVYDVALQSDVNFFNIIEASPFIVKPNVTTKGCIK